MKNCNGKHNSVNEIINCKPCQKLIDEPLSLVDIFYLLKSADEKHNSMQSNELLKEEKENLFFAIHKDIELAKNELLNYIKKL